MKKPEKVLVTIAAWWTIAIVIPCASVGFLAALPVACVFLLAALVVFGVRSYRTILADRKAAHAEWLRLVAEAEQEAAAAPQAAQDDEPRAYKSPKRSSVNGLQDRIASEIKSREEGGTK